MEENKNLENNEENEGLKNDEITNQNTEAETTNPVEIVEDEEQFGLGREVFEWIQAIVVALVIALALRTFVFTLVNVEGASMEPTLQNGDRLVVTRLGYVPQQGDVIIFRPKMHKDTPYVKRVIATPGQTVNIDFNAGKVFVDGKEIQEAYIKAPTHERGNSAFPSIVPPNSVFVMGDNRNNSRDSRFTDVGMVEDSTIIGHAVYRLWPFNNIGNLK